MNEAYKIAITLAVTDRATGVFKGLYMQIARLGTETEALNIKLKKLKSAFNFGMGTVAGGAILAVPILYAIDKAAQLQKQMIAIGLATKGTTGEMDNMRHVIEKMSGVTVFSSIQIAGMVKQMATGMALPARQLTSLIPVFAKFADVQYMLKGAPAEQSIGIGIRAAHLAGHYTPESMSKYLNLLNKVSLVIPGNLSEVANALQYSQSVAKSTLGVSDENMVVLVALLNRMGIKGTRGGTNLIAAMSRSIPGVFGSGLLKGKSAEAAREMGMVDKHGHSTVFTNGKFDTVKWMAKLSQFETDEYARYPAAIARQNIVKAFHNLMGVQGSRVGALFATPQAAQQLALINAAILRMPNVVTTQETFKKLAVSQQFMNAKANFTSLMVELGWTLLPDVTKGLNLLNKYLKELIAYIQSHPGSVEKFVKAVAGLSIVLVIAGGITILGTALASLGVILAVLTAPLTGIIAAFALFGYGLIKLREMIKPYIDKLHLLGGPSEDRIFGNVSSPSSASTRPPTYLLVDGKKLGEIVSHHQSHAATLASNGTSLFDLSMSAPHTSQNFVGGF